MLLSWCCSAKGLGRDTSGPATQQQHNSNSPSMKAATKLASSLPFGELDRLVKAIGECKSKSEEDRIIAAEVDVLKQRLSDPRLDKTRGREYMVSSSSTGHQMSVPAATAVGVCASVCDTQQQAQSPQHAATFPPAATNLGPQLGCSLAPAACPASAAGRLQSECLSIVLCEVQAAVADGNWQPRPPALRPACLSTHPALPCACACPALCLYCHISCPVLSCPARVLYCSVLLCPVRFV